MTSVKIEKKNYLYYIPDAFIFCIILTIAVILSGTFFSSSTFIEVVGIWQNSLWNLNAFSMQMVMILLLGHLLANAPSMSRLIDKIVLACKTPLSALIILCLFSLGGSYLNWGFGLIFSALLCLKMAEKFKHLPFALFVATAYCGFINWHGGLSGSIPLKVSGQDEILQIIYPNLSLPLTSTIFSNLNLIILVGIFIIFPIASYLMFIKAKSHEVNFKFPRAQQVDEDFSSLGEKSSWILPLMGILLLISLVIVIAFQDKSFEINSMNSLLLLLCFFLYKTPRNFLSSLKNSLPVTGGIMIQFPFYAAMMGVMSECGLVEQLSLWLISFSKTETLPVLTFYSAGLVNFFVPSGGGQWVIQGPIILKAVQTLNADLSSTLIALSWGDAWTNLIQPFWAIPILSVSKIPLSKIMSFCFIYFLISGIWITLCLILI